MPRNTLALHEQVRREQRQAQYERLGFADYYDYLRSPHWADVRRAYSESGLTQQCVCGSYDVQLHHRTYERLGAEELRDLVPLCRRCHAMIHALEYRGEFLDYRDFASLERANQYFDQTRSIRQRAQEEAPEPNEDRAYRIAKERSRARRKRRHGKKKTDPPVT